MPLYNNDDLMRVGYEKGFAVGAFNINNMEILQGIVEAAALEQSPVIIAVSSGALKYAGAAYLVGMARTAAFESGVPLSIHLDHGADYAKCVQAINAGFSSIMIDASKLPFEENVAASKRAAELAHACGCSCEAELGRLEGIEEHVEVAAGEAVLTDPDQAAEFVERTGVDSLAVAIGTSHGAYKFKGVPKLDFDRLQQIRSRVDVPLVLHGASAVPDWVRERAEKHGAELGGSKGVPDEAVSKAVTMGVSKVNIDTDLRLAMLGAVREILDTDRKQFDPRKYLGPARAAITKVVRHKMQLLGSSGKAKLYG
jgi:fructose-bisphosphate aldolase class II